MLGIELINKVYKDNSIAPGTKIECNHRIFSVESVKSGNALRECIAAPNTGKMIHNCAFSELLDFMNSECFILTQFTFSEAARRNGKMKPSTLDHVGYMNLKEALSYLSSVSDASLLKSLLEDKIWYAKEETKQSKIGL